jgi:hypothetical protein
LDLDRPADSTGGDRVLIVVEHGREDYGHLIAPIAADCPKMRNPAADIYDRCRVHFPELPRWF